MSLPTEKRKPTPGMGKVLLYAEPKVGKSTLAATMDPEHTLVLDTENGTAALEAFVHPIKSWSAITKEEPHVLRGDSFRGAIKALVDEEHDFTTAVVDTVDVLAQLCGDDVLRALGGQQAGFLHASDFDYGKGWSAITAEFQLRMGALCRAVPNVVFISHADESVKQDRTGAEYKVYTPALAPKGVRNWLLGFVDHILFAEVVSGEAGEERVLRTQPTRSYQAGGRTPLGAPKLPDPLPLEGPALKAALEALAAPARPAAKPKGSRSKPKPTNTAQEGEETPPAGDGGDGQQTLGAAA